MQKQTFRVEVFIRLSKRKYGPFWDYCENISQ